MSDEPIATLADERTAGERLAWRLLGPPLYYCAACLRRVQVAGDPPEVQRACTHDDAPIIAPRKAIVAGEGGLNTANKLRLAWWQAGAKLTGRSI